MYGRTILKLFAGGVQHGATRIGGRAPPPVRIFDCFVAVFVVVFRGATRIGGRASPPVRAALGAAMEAGTQVILDFGLDAFVTFMPNLSRNAVAS